MIPVSPYDIMRITDRRAIEAERRAQTRRLLKEAAAAGTGWMPPPIAWLLNRAGRLLVATGRRLQHMGARPGPAMAGQVAAQGYQHILSGSQR